MLAYVQQTWLKNAQRKSALGGRRLFQNVLPRIIPKDYDSSAAMT
jgi:hypothetical protein